MCRDLIYVFSLFQERLELISKQYEADKAKLEKIRLLLVMVLNILMVYECFLDLVLNLLEKCAGEAWNRIICAWNTLGVMRGITRGILAPKSSGKILHMESFFVGHNVSFPLVFFPVV